MAKMRVHELAKELNIKSQDIIELLSTTDYAVKSASSGIEDAAQAVVRNKFSKKEDTKPAAKAEKAVTKAEDAKTEEEACEVLGKLAGSVGRRLRKAGQKAGMISVEIKYYNFENSSHQTQLERATNEDARIYETAAELFREMWKKQPIRLLGIRSSKLTDAFAPEQLTIFEVQPEMEKRKKASEKKAKLEQALKEIRGRYGEEAVIRGSNMEEKREKEK